MRLAMLNLMRLMANGAVAEEAIAQEFAEEAALADADGEAESAAALRAMARQRRVQALEIDGRLAAMKLHYQAMFD